MYEFKKIKKITIFEFGIIRPYNQIEQGQRNKKKFNKNLLEQVENT